jgi:hypothetical protein
MPLKATENWHLGWSKANNRLINSQLIEFRINYSGFGFACKSDFKETQIAAVGQKRIRFARKKYFFLDFFTKKAITAKKQNRQIIR